MLFRESGLIVLFCIHYYRSYLSLLDNHTIAISYDEDEECNEGLQCAIENSLVPQPRLTTLSCSPKLVCERVVINDSVS